MRYGHFLVESDRNCLACDFVTGENGCNYVLDVADRLSRDVVRGMEVRVRITE